MEKITLDKLEKFLNSEISNQDHHKVWRCNIKKIITLQNENPTIEFLDDLISLGKRDPKYSHLQNSTWNTIRKNTETCFSFVQNSITKIQLVDEPLQTVDDISSIAMKDQIANLNAKSKLQAEQHEITRLQIIEDEKRLLKIQEDELKRQAEIKAQALTNKIDSIFEGFESEKIPEDVLQFDKSDFLAKEAPEYYQQYTELDDTMLSLMCDQACLLSGVSGSGKTELLRRIGHNLRQQDKDKEAYVLKLSCGQDTKQKQLLDSLGMNIEQKVKRVLGVVAKAIMLANETGKWVIVILDEINLLTPKSQKLLNGILDGSRFLDSDLGKIQRNKGSRLFLAGTMNANYSGTQQLNVEFKDRFNEVLTYKPTRDTLDKIFVQFDIAQDEKDSIIKIYEELDKAQMVKDVTEKAKYTIRSMCATMQKLEMLEFQGVEKSVRLQRAVNMSLTNKFNDEVDHEKVVQIVNGVLNC